MSAAVPFVRDPDVRHGECVRLSGLVRRVTAPNPGPFTYTGTGTHIVGQGRVAVIDPGPDLPGHLAALLAALDGEEVADILVTHTHRDHSPLAAALKARTGAVVWGLPPPTLAEDAIRLDEAHDADFRPDRLPSDGDVIAGSGWTIRAFLTPGHASNHMAFALAEENALFSGDHVMGWSTTVVAPPDGDMDAYMDSLERTRAADFAVLYPTHGPPVTEVAQFLTAYRDHRLDREAQILRRLAEGMNRIPEIVEANYADIDPRLHPAAALSTLAHLARLAKHGRVAADPGVTLDASYRLAGRDGAG